MSFSGHILAKLVTFLSATAMVYCHIVNVSNANTLNYWKMVTMVNIIPALHQNIQPPIVSIFAC